VPSHTTCRRRLRDDRFTRGDGAQSSRPDPYVLYSASRRAIPAFPDEAIQAVRQVDNVRELGATLARRSYEGLRLETAIFRGEYHLTVFPAAFGQGLRWMVD
jgi:hypothetical protein